MNEKAPRTDPLAAEPQQQLELPEVPLALEFVFPTPGEVITSLATGNTYRIGDVIGEGSFGVVYACTDTWENALAVKVLKPRDTYEELRRHAVGELNRLHLLRHPNITYVYDAFEFRRAFFIVFERCWKSMNQFISQNGFKGDLWLRAIARQVLQAVHFLHVNNYVHQDIHGGNVFIAAVHDDMAPDDLIFSFMLGDLGISKMATEIDARNTLLANWMLAPEAIDPSEFGVMDRRMDIYHCGLLFLQILLGREHHFTREETLAGAPRELALAVGGPFSFALEKALRRHVDYRTASALEFWRDINTPAAPQTSNETIAKWLGESR